MIERARNLRVGVRMIRTNSIRSRVTLLATAIGLGIAAGGAAVAQNQPTSSASGLNLPENPTVFGNALPSVVKATAIINGETGEGSAVDAHGGTQLTDEDRHFIQEQARVHGSASPGEPKFFDSVGPED
jgi:hypothetical protein